jgi:hypothetical protein
MPTYWSKASLPWLSSDFSDKQRRTGTESTKEELGVVELRRADDSRELPCCPSCSRASDPVTTNCSSDNWPSVVALGSAWDGAEHAVSLLLVACRGVAVEAHEWISATGSAVSDGEELLRSDVVESVLAWPFLSRNGCNGGGGEGNDITFAVNEPLLYPVMEVTEVLICLLGGRCCSWPSSLSRYLLFGLHSM